MRKYDRIVDYIIEQADRNDAKSLQFEQDIMLRIRKSRDRVFPKIINKVGGCNNLVEMQGLLTLIETIMQMYLHECKVILNNKFSTHYSNGFKNTEQLLDVGLDIEKRYSRNVKEMSIDYDKGTINYIQTHSFDMLTGYSSNIISKLRAELGNMVLSGTANKPNVKAMVEKVLSTNKSKAEEIAQTELSRVYNFGVLARLDSYEKESGNRVQKYWHGFMYSPRTCDYCIDKIGNVYDLHDDSEQLPAHVRCRCVWLPILDGWDKPIDRGIIARANMLNTGYSEEQIYNRLNTRLGIDYAEYMNVSDAVEYLEGDRSPAIMSKIATARQHAIDYTKDKFDISYEVGTDTWSKRFNSQIKFWMDITSEAIVDNNKDSLNKYYEGLKTVMVLPWSSEQLSKWNKLLYNIDEARN